MRPRLKRLLGSIPGGPAVLSRFGTARFLGRELVRDVAGLWDRMRPGDPGRELSGKNVLITGASSGIGAALAPMCAGAGAHVILVARREPELAALAANIAAAGGRASYHVSDLSDLDACAALVGTVLAEHDGVDVLVNNAARSIRRSVADSVDRFHDFERIMRLNYLAPVRLTLGFLPGMRARGWGRIANVLSAGAKMPAPRFSAYVASKAALGAFSDACAAEVFHEQVLVTSFYFGLVRTPMIDATETFSDNRNVTTASDAAQQIVDGIVRRERHVQQASTTRRALWNLIAPVAMTRALNVLYRIYADDPEFALDRAVLERFVKGSLM